MREPIADRLRWVGRDLYLMGLVSTRSGNLSVRVGDTVVITRTGALLGRLTPEDLVEVPVAGPGDADADASADLPVHREIYSRSDARAVVHAHPVATVALAFESGPIRPVDHEGRLFTPEVPVFDEIRPRTELAARVGDAVAGGTRIVAVRGHGIFAAGDAIESATHWTTCLELSARLLLEMRSAGIRAD